MGVTGMGGLFFRAKDPEALAKWYKEHLGVGGGCVAEGLEDEPNEWVWSITGGPMVFQPFKADSDYFEPITRGAERDQRGPGRQGGPCDGIRISID